MAELACKHCGKMDFPEAFLIELDELREEWDKPIIVNSAYRCPNSDIEKDKKNGPGEHSRGAIDIHISGSDVYFLVSLVIKRGWSGIGLQQKGPNASRFLHIDRGIARFDAPRPTIWTY